MNAILFTLTDYRPDESKDTGLIKQLFDAGTRELFFFPQGNLDLEYLQSLEIYKTNKSKFTLLPHDYTVFCEFVRTTRFNYTGTRLHAGIYCLNAHHPSLIISIDNRAEEIAKDIGLHIAGRTDFETIAGWFANSYTPEVLNLPLKNINDWKNQFR